jgi:hypothetical protein
MAMNNREVFLFNHYGVASYGDNGNWRIGFDTFDDRSFQSLVVCVKELKKVSHYMIP